LNSHTGSQVTAVGLAIILDRTQICNPKSKIQNPNSWNLKSEIRNSAIPHIEPKGRHVLT